ncbi:MAG: DNA-directed RNA polymerase subunit alpha [Elusimicrobia bacterium]|nr:DNA-directed RNA polymerase subunit alpha [Elusimicrobiota bacterium]
MKLSPIVMPKRLELDKKTATDTFGKFIAEPFERGYGHTIGNSLRRILLNSLEGAAITNIKIEGVLHEFSSIPGIKEDVTEIILNLKKVRFKLYTNSHETIYLRATKQGVATAGQIEINSNVEVLNPDQVIATLNPGSKLEIMIEVNKGRGYVIAERNKKEGQDIGLIPIDSIFTPVFKVNYTVENARVGQMTDYDRLIMEIWTDGSVSPEDALAYAAKILKDSLEIFINFEEEEIKIEKAEESAAADEEEKIKKFRDLLGQSVDIIELSIRAQNCLRVAKIKIIGDLVQRREQDLLKVKNFGKKSLNEIIKKLKELDLSLGLELPPQEKE